VNIDDNVTKIPDSTSLVKTIPEKIDPGVDLEIDLEIDLEVDMWHN